jgi:hypothetical protein
MYIHLKIPKSRETVSLNQFFCVLLVKRSVQSILKICISSVEICRSHKYTSCWLNFGRSNRLVAFYQPAPSFQNSGGRPEVGEHSEGGAEQGPPPQPGKR